VYELDVPYVLEEFTYTGGALEAFFFMIVVPAKAVDAISINNSVINFFIASVQGIAETNRQ